MDLSELEGELANCQACPLRNDAIAPVAGTVIPKARLCL